jgi:hypothetical protein
MFAIVLVQQSLAGLLGLSSQSFGRVSPDLMAAAAVVLTLRARHALDVALAAWGMGLAVDLTTASGPAGTTVVGPMAIGYVAASAIVFRIREAFFREHWLTQGFFAVVFCVIAHAIWIVLQALAGWRGATVSTTLRALGQMLWIALYTGAVTSLLSRPMSFVVGVGVLGGLVRTRRRKRSSRR